MRISDWSSDVCSSDLLSDIAQRMRTANDAVCRAVATRRERTGIAMREHARTRADQGGAQRGHLQIMLKILVTNPAPFSFEHIDVLRRVPQLAHASQRPTQIDSVWRSPDHRLLLHRQGVTT